MKSIDSIILGMRLFSPRCRFASVLLCATAAVSTLARQAPDPKAAFIQALGQFSLALDGSIGDEAGRIRSSLVAMERGLQQWDATILAYEAAMASEIKSADPPLASRMHAALAGVYLDRGRTADALRELTTAGEPDARRSVVHILQALALGQMGESERATLAYRNAMATSLGDPVAAYTFARHLVRIGQHEEARGAMKQVVDRWKVMIPSGRPPASGSPFLRLGLVEDVSGVEPFFPPVAYAEGFALLHAGRFEPALERLKDAITGDPLFADPGPETELMAGGVAAFRNGDAALAIVHLTAAAAKAPARAEPRRVLGLVYAADGQQDQAIDALSSAVRLNPKDERSRMALADALMRIDRLTAAEEALTETVKWLPTSGKARYTLGLVYQRQGKYQEAIEQFERAVALAPLLGLNSLYRAIGAIHVDRQNFEAAIAAFGKRVDALPNDAGAHRQLGEAFVKAGRDEEALAEFAVAAMLHAAEPEAHAAMAQVHLRAGRYAEAVDASRRALEQDPVHTQARYALATSLIRLGKADEGRQELQLFQRLQAEVMEARSRVLELGGLAREAAEASSRGEYAKAVDLRRQVLDYDRSAPAHVDLGLALLRAGQPAEALESFRTALGRPGSFEVHRHLADAYQALGEIDLSRQEQATYQQMKQDALRRKNAGLRSVP